MLESTENKIVYIVEQRPNPGVFDFNIRFNSVEDIHVAISGDVNLTREVEFDVESKTSYDTGAKIILHFGIGNLPALSAMIGKKVVIWRSVPERQDTTLPNRGLLPSKELEKQLDKIVMMIQQHYEKINRSVKVPITGNATPEGYWEEMKHEITVAAGTASAAASISVQNAALASAAAATAENAKNTAVSAKNTASAAAVVSAAAGTAATSAAEEVRRLVSESSVAKVTFAFGSWGSADGMYVSYDEWTAAPSVISVDEKLNAHNEDPDAHEAIRQSVSALGGTVAQIRQSVSALDGTVAQIGQSVSALGGTVAALGGTVAEIKDTVENIGNTIPNLVGRPDWANMAEKTNVYLAAATSTSARWKVGSKGWLYFVPTNTQIRICHIATNASVAIAGDIIAGGRLSSSQMVNGPFPVTEEDRLYINTALNAGTTTVYTESNFGFQIFFIPEN